MRTQRHFMAAALLALAAGLTTACTEKASTTPEAPQLAIVSGSAMSVTPATASVAVAASTQLTATLRNRRGRLVSGIQPLWLAQDSAIAGVSQTGVVTGRKAGTVLVSATYYGVSAAMSITVTGAATTPPVVTPPPTPTPTPPPVGTSGRWVSGYYAGYQRGLYPETAIDFSLLTHIIVVGIEPTGNGGVSTDFFVDAVNGPAMARTIATRAHAAGRKALLMLGGSGYRDALAASASSGTIATFVTNLISTMTSLGYDGIDVDWEPISTADQPAVLDLLKRLRAAKPDIILTLPGPWNGPLTSWYASAAAQLDQLNMMSYGMSGNWGGWSSWHEAAVTGESSVHPSSLAASLKLYQNAGVPLSKIGVGIGYYGSCWRNVNAMGVPLGAGQDIVADDNTMSYTNIMSQYYNAASYKWDATAKEGYLAFSSLTGPAQCSMVSFNDPQGVTEKGNFVRANGLGGAILWTINQGYLPNAAIGSRDPLTKAAYTAIAP